MNAKGGYLAMNGEKLVAYLGLVLLSTPYGWVILAAAFMMLAAIVEEPLRLIGVVSDPAPHTE